MSKLNRKRMVLLGSHGWDMSITPDATRMGSDSWADGKC